MRWLFRWFFLEKWIQPNREIEVAAHSYREPLYVQQFQRLVAFLKIQLCEEIFFIAEQSGRVIHIRSSDTLMARVSIHPKGSPSATYIVVRMSPEFVKQKVWFQLAFLGFKLHFHALSADECKVQVLLPRR